MSLLEPARLQCRNLTGTAGNKHIKEAEVADDLHDQ